MAKLLLAEDDEFSRDMLTRRLQKLGFEVITAADGREALRAVRQNRPDLILMDLDMPVLDGYAAMRSLKTDPRTAKIPIIVLTAHASPESVAEAVEAGCHSYEAKPVVVRRLVERIQEVLGPAAPESETPG
jgi:CheY-like chemotaxis protein